MKTLSRRRVLLSSALLLLALLALLAARQLLSPSSNMGTDMPIRPGLDSSAAAAPTPTAASGVQSVTSGDRLVLQGQVPAGGSGQFAGAKAPAVNRYSPYTSQPRLAAPIAGGVAAQSTGHASKTAPMATVAPASDTVVVEATNGQKEPQPDSTPTTATPPAPRDSFVKTADDHLSTFALDVDTGSYTAARNYIVAGTFPPPDTVRIEEFVNYFRYDYPAPEGATFGIYADGAHSPIGNPGAQVVRVGIQGQRIDDSRRKDAVLTFVIDISGSMAEPNRLPLVKEALHLLVNDLRPTDQVGIVVFGSDARVLLDSVGAGEHDRIMQAIDALADEGSTNTEAGLRLGYELAAQHLKPGAINRVILCSDGVANVGATSPDAIRQSIRDYTKQGIQLTTVGFGMGDYNDQLMEQLADDGDGNYAYVDTLSAARRIFVQNLTGMLQVIAKDAKVQVDFNPAVVSRYRLLGYENRDVADNNFRNDSIDAGEVGAGHSVTALYEIELTGKVEGPAFTVQLRYADPKSGQVSEIKRPFDTTAFKTDFASSSPRFQLAVATAAFADQLRTNSLLGAQDHSQLDVLAIAQRIAPLLSKDQDVQEFAQLVAKAYQIGQVNTLPAPAVQPQQGIQPAVP